MANCIVSFDSWCSYVWDCTWAPSFKKVKYQDDSLIGLVYHPLLAELLMLVFDYNCNNIIKIWSIERSPFLLSVKLGLIYKNLILTGRLIACLAVDLHLRGTVSPFMYVYSIFLSSGVYISVFFSCIDSSQVLYTA